MKPSPPATSPTPRPLSWFDRIARRGWIAAAAAGFAVFLPALFYGFTYDDLMIIVNNGRIRHLGRPAQYLGTNWWDMPEGNFLYRPAPMTSFAIDYALHGLHPFVYHLVNNLLHALNAACLWFFGLHLARRGDRGASGPAPYRAATVAALLFAVLAVHVEAVAGVVGRAELMMTLGYLLALVAACKSQEASGQGERLHWAGLVFAATLLSAFSKEHGATLPASVALLALTPPAVSASFSSRKPRSEPLSDRVHSLVPALMAATAGVGAYLIARKIVLGAFVKPASSQIPVADNPLTLLSGLPRIQATLDVLLRQAGSFFLPLRPSPNYGLAVLMPQDLAEGWLWPFGLLLLGLALSGFWFLRRRPLALAGLGLTFVTMALSSNLLILIGTILADRLLYLPSAALCLIAGDAMLADFPPRRFRAAAIALLLWGIVQTLLLWNYLPNWRDNWALIQYAIKRVPESSNIQIGCALALRDQGKTEEALAHIEEAERLNPDGLKERVWRAVIWAETGRPEALNELEIVHAAHEGMDVANRELARLLTAKGETARAERILREGVRLAPRSQTGWLALIEWLADQGRNDEAQALYRPIELYLVPAQKAEAQSHFDSSPKKP